MKLFKIKQNGNRYCGPSVISALTGIGTKQASKVIRSINGRTLVKVSSGKDVLSALSQLGVKGDRITATRLNLLRWAEQHADDGETYLVLAGHHWIIVQGRYAQCGKTIDLVKVETHPNARAFVVAAYCLTQLETMENASGASSEAAQVIAYQGVEATRSRAAEPPALKQKREMVALAKKNAISLVKKRNGLVQVTPPAWLDAEDDPYLDDHVCLNLTTANARVKDYAAIIGECTLLDFKGIGKAQLDREWAAIQRM